MPSLRAQARGKALMEARAIARADEILRSHMGDYAEEFKPLTAKDARKIIPQEEWDEKHGRHRTKTMTERCDWLNKNLTFEQAKLLMETLEMDIPDDIEKWSVNHICDEIQKEHPEIMHGSLFNFMKMIVTCRATIDSHI